MAFKAITADPEESAVVAQYPDLCKFDDVPFWAMFLFVQKIVTAVTEGIKYLEGDYARIGHILPALEAIEGYVSKIPCPEGESERFEKVKKCVIERFKPYRTDGHDDAYALPVRLSRWEKARGNPN